MLDITNRIYFSIQTTITVFGGPIFETGDPERD
jgi:hypothetical protein